MWTILIYVLVIIISNIAGAISGMGGGSIIKPLLDLLQLHSVAEISFYSSVAVLVMAFVSTYRQSKSKVQINWNLAITVALGSIIGGTLGNITFEALLVYFSDELMVNLVQIIITVCVLIYSYIFSNNPKQFNMSRNALVELSVGFILGYLSSLLGIGGGPLNVVLISMVFSISMKDATVYSIVVILFSQSAKIISILLAGTHLTYDLSILWAIIPSAIIGGYFGSLLNSKFSEDMIIKVYQIVVITVLLINVYNGFSIILA